MIMLDLPAGNLGEAINIAITIVGAGIVTLFTAGRAARRAVADELTKLRNARGFERRARWYERARRELRALGGYGGMLMKATVDVEYGVGDGLDSPLHEEHKRAVSTVQELILDAVVYATPETVATLTHLNEALEELSPQLVILTGAIQENSEASAMALALSEAFGDNIPPEARSLADERVKAGLCVSSIHARMTLAMHHVLRETRTLHGYSDIDGELDIPGGVIVDATLDPIPPSASRSRSKVSRRRPGT
ncbi:hypothetical protein [Gemmatimonas sp. UBA7669]|uniref:hypothetical protein n=1 Tax=Gemmatimonas sp. UBA7669 TaxID=1946568 RepID=UPI0025C443A0|nr:hypothetical protein [Gemmatimonas sp. UBA7669]